jgi:anti-sigma-K factor RskA
MIDERTEELAGLYVLGALAPREHHAFEAALRRDAELQTVVDALRAARDAMAGAVPAATPSPQLKQRIMAEISAREKKQVAAPARTSLADILGYFLSWGLTAATAVVCLVIYNQEKAVQSQLFAQTARVQELSQMADSLRNATNSLAQTVVALQETNKLANVRIALLGSLLSDSPKAVAVSLWDNQRQSGVFVVQNLKPLPPDRDYQLWVIDPKYKIPVSAGVFQVDNQGDVRMQFTAVKTIVTADKFAVTLEPKGGLPTPTLKNLVLLGG